MNDIFNENVPLKTETPAFAKDVLYAGAVEKARISIYNEDCLQALKAMADKQFDLAIVDPLMVLEQVPIQELAVLIP